MTMSTSTDGTPPGSPSHAALTSYGHPKTSISMLKFKEKNNQNISNMLKKELALLKDGVPIEKLKSAFSKEMNNFHRLFERFLYERNVKLDWNMIKSTSEDLVLPYASIRSKEFDNGLFNKLAVIKLNGGLGTTMGCVGPKSAIHVRDGMNFLDLTVRQLEHLNNSYSCKIPLILMNSFNTSKETERMIGKYGNSLEIVTFNQSRYPRISSETLMPIAERWDDEGENWYPPGHGDLFAALEHSGLLDQLLAAGKEYVFVSNIDNLGASVDPNILSYMHNNGNEFIMEVTNKTRADVKGGTLIDYDGHVRLLEIAQVPPEHDSDFKKKFKIFNTNNIWINLNAVKKRLDSLEMQVIINKKKCTKGQVIQLETALGAAIQHFDKAIGINVDRHRFLPVKKCSDLFLLQSDLYLLSGGQISINPQRNLPMPLVKLGPEFKHVSEYLRRIKGPLHIMELEHLTVTGNVNFGSGCTLKGSVIIVARDGDRIDIPDNSLLEDKIVTGSLRILDH